MGDNNYIFGRNAVLEALKSGQGIEKVFIAFGCQGPVITKIYATAKRAGVRCINYDKRKFRALEEKAGVRSEKSQGIIAMVQLVETLSVQELINKCSANSDKPIIVILDGINDPHNLGAISRSAECAGAAGLLISERDSAPITPVAVKTSAGALSHMPVARVGSLVSAVEKLKDAGYWIVGTDMDGDHEYTDDIYDSPIGLVIGSEGKGMHQPVRKKCDFIVSIPLHGKINSLNASVSAGVVLFEMARQRSVKNNSQ